MSSLPNVAIIELGSQYTPIIARTLREIGVRSEILQPKDAGLWLEKNPVKAVILSGGPASVYQDKAPQPPKEILSLRTKHNQPVPVLGICYGMQWIAHTLSGKVENVAHHSEYGPAEIFLDAACCALFYGTPQQQKVWASHGDTVMNPPPEFDVLARAASGGIAAMMNRKQTIFGVQFHPEVKQTDFGKPILENFVKRIAKCEEDWKPEDMVAKIQEDVARRVGDSPVVLPYSGGVDSTVLAAILGPALGARGSWVTMDCGHLRSGEIEDICLNARIAGIAERHRVIAAKKTCLIAFKSLASTDAAEKRECFQKIYANVFWKEGDTLRKQFGPNTVVYLAQGTLATDLIESGATGGAQIKAHHNILSVKDVTLLHPLGHLFKDEVRALGKMLRLPDNVFNREPFPGPGFFVRIIGAPITKENLDIVRWADVQVREILKHHRLYKDISQLIVAYFGVNTVGVKGDARTYKGMIGVRAVQTDDFMTASGYFFPEPAWREINRTLTGHPEVVRAFFDSTNKPPATTEFE